MGPDWRAQAVSPMPAGSDDGHSTSGASGSGIGGDQLFVQHQVREPAPGRRITTHHTCTEALHRLHLPQTALHEA